MTSISVRFFLLLLAVTLITCVTGCAKPDPPTITLYCSETYWPMMREASLTFRCIYGIRVEMMPVLALDSDGDVEKSTSSVSSIRKPAPWRSRPKLASSLETDLVTLDRSISHLIASLEDGRPGDMFLTDSSQQIDRLKELALVTNEYSFCYLAMTLLVARDNPLAIESARDALSKKLRLGIMDPSKDGMGLAATELLSRFSGEFDTEILLQQIVRFPRQKALLEALEQGEIDAALVWEPLTDRAEFAMPIPLWERSVIEEGNYLETEETRENPEHLVVLQTLYSLRLTADEAYGRRFADFLLSTQGRDILLRHGFIPKRLD